MGIVREEVDCINRRIKSWFFYGLYGDLFKDCSGVENVILSMLRVVKEL